MANEQLSLDLPEPKKKRGRKRKINYGRGQIGFGAKSGDMKIKEKGSGLGKATKRGRFVVSGRDALKYVPKGKIDRFNQANQLKLTGAGFSTDPKDIKKFAEKKNFTKTQTAKAVKAASSLNNLRQKAATVTGIPKVKVGGKTLNSLLAKANKKVPLTNLRKLMSASMPVALIESFSPKKMADSTKKGSSKSIMESIDKEQKASAKRNTGKKDLTKLEKQAKAQFDASRSITPAMIRKAGITGGSAKQRLNAFMNMHVITKEGKIQKRARSLKARDAKVNDMIDMALGKKPKIKRKIDHSSDYSGRLRKK
tara:strand:+ start:296 stop:1225 length:930 start_codon:yes stop_codon:yes gene_type:complete